MQWLTIPNVQMQLVQCGISKTKILTRTVLSGFSIYSSVMWAARVNQSLALIFIHFMDEFAFFSLDLPLCLEIIRNALNLVLIEVGAIYGYW